MGFVRRQVWLSVFWQTATLVSIALVIGIPLGALLGRFAWNVFAKDLGAIAEPQVAWLPFLLIVPAAFVLAGLVAVVPAWLADARARASRSGPSDRDASGGDELLDAGERLVHVLGGLLAPAHDERLAQARLL